jgi:cysteine desulfurase
MVLTSRVYFDNSATTPIDPRVAEEMKRFILGDNFGNPSSMHQEGLLAREAVEVSRKSVADLIGSTEGEVVFTGSGTEADNMAILGVRDAFSGKREGFHVITSAIEHPAILETCRYVERHGGEVTYLPVDHDGLVSPDSLASEIRPETHLVSIMAANNVVGTVQPVRELARIAHENGAIFHTDAVQAAGKIPIRIRDDEIDLLSMSAHKLYGPKGVGALIIREGTLCEPLIHGGGQERGKRSSTENVAGIVGFGKAAGLAKEEMVDEQRRLTALRKRLVEVVEDIIENAYLIGHREKRIPGHICLGLRQMEGEAIRLLFLLDEHGIAVSTGSACSAHHAGEPSHILTAMGFDPIQARGALRITLGRFNTSGEVDVFLDLFPRIVASLNTVSSI